MFVSIVTDATDEITLAGVLDLQTRCHFETQTAPEQSGFLITRHAPAELRRLVDEGSTLILAKAGPTVNGYLLLSPPGVLEHLDPDFVPAAGLDERGPAMKYVFQVAVAPERRRSGVAAALIDAAKSASPSGLLADVLDSPIRNAPSLRLFERCGFRRIGTFEFPDYPGFGPHSSAVFAWTH